MGRKQAFSHLQAVTESCVSLLGSRGAHATGTAVPYTQLGWRGAHPVRSQACKELCASGIWWEACLLLWLQHAV